MMDYDDFEEISRLLVRSCDNCLLTRKHCKSCRVEKLFGVINQFSRSKASEVFLVPAEELAILLSLSAKVSKPGQQESEIITKWRAAMDEFANRTVSA
ncbi:MAG: hypothetical protein ACYC0Q_05840 [Eubacteriales bacterium]|nr:hypothetical protein [Bacillota bacterium]